MSLSFYSVLLLLGIYIISKQFDRTVQLITGTVMVVIAVLALGIVNIR